MSPVRWQDFLTSDGAWEWPQRLNMAAQVCDDWAASAPDRTALVDLSGTARNAVSYGALQRLSWQVQAALLAQGAARGDRIGVFLSQSALCAASHIAIWRMGAISVPLFTLFGADALATRLEDSGARLVVSDEPGAKTLAPFTVQTLREADLPDASGPPNQVETGPDDPAVLMYTSGTTGNAKGALHGHRLLLGHLPGVITSHDGLGAPGDCLWTPADWAWIGGLFDVLMPGLALGLPVVAARMGKFRGAEAAEICAQEKVRNVFFPPTALRMLKAEGIAIPGLRSVASGGEPLGAEMRAWGRRAFGLGINEFYGQTECNMVVSGQDGVRIPPGAIGRAVTGFEVAVVDAVGAPTEHEGDIAVRRGAPSMMLGYWQNPSATAEKFRGTWMLTGDRGVMEDGFLRFVGREDDVISSAGYRMGPAEIEDCLLTHPSVATVGVVGKPDPLRREIVKAYVVLKPGFSGDVAAIRTHVKTRLAAHLAPREIEFVAELPMTVTGKVIRKALRARAHAEVPA